MNWYQKEIHCKSTTRGFVLITDIIINQIPEISDYKTGILHLFIKHTSASITINENADPTVRDDLESHFDKTVPENEPNYTHTCEGPDDMPAHIKSALTQTSISIPIENFEITLGSWQGIYLFEHRKSPHKRIIKIHLIG